MIRELLRPWPQSPDTWQTSLRTRCSGEWQRPTTGPAREHPGKALVSWRWLKAVHGNPSATATMTRFGGWRSDNIKLDFQLVFNLYRSPRDADRSDAEVMLLQCGLAAVVLIGMCNMQRNRARRAVQGQSSLDQKSIGTLLPNAVRRETDFVELTGIQNLRPEHAILYLLPFVRREIRVEDYEFA